MAYIHHQQKAPVAARFMHFDFCAQASDNEKPLMYMYVWLPIELVFLAKCQNNIILATNIYGWAKLNNLKCLCLYTKTRLIFYRNFATKLTIPNEGLSQVNFNSCEHEEIMLIELPFRFSQELTTCSTCSIGGFLFKPYCLHSYCIGVFKMVI